ncbi:hypothetical protein [Nostoc sp. WHI]|nr:hypothetical protein [Nostoc sp. WHI]
MTKSDRLKVCVTIMRSPLISTIKQAIALHYRYKPLGCCSKV